LRPAERVGLLQSVLVSDVHLLWCCCRRSQWCSLVASDTAAAAAAAVCAGYCDATCGYCNVSTPAPTSGIASPFNAISTDIQNLCNNSAYVTVTNWTQLRDAEERVNGTNATILCYQVCVAPFPGGSSHSVSGSGPRHGVHLITRVHRLCDQHSSVHRLRWCNAWGLLRGERGRAQPHKRVGVEWRGTSKRERSDSHTHTHTHIIL
jgi:hypothetical protein